MPVPTLVALAIAFGALLLSIAAYVSASRLRRETDAALERLDDERQEWRAALEAIQRRAEEAYDRASQPSMPGDATLRLQGAAEGVEDLRQEMASVHAALRRESEQRLATEVALFGSLDDLRNSMPKATATSKAPARKPRSSSLFEIVEFGDDTATAGT